MKHQGTKVSQTSSAISRNIGFLFPPIEWQYTLTLVHRGQAGCHGGGPSGQ